MYDHNTFVCVSYHLYNYTIETHVLSLLLKQIIRYYTYVCVSVCILYGSLDMSDVLNMEIYL